VGAANGTMYRVPLSGATGPTVTVTLATNPAIRVTTEYNGAVTVHRGSLVYALQLEEAFATTHVYYNTSTGAAADYTVKQPPGSATPWNAALVLDPANPGASLAFKRVGAVPAVPFSSHEASVVITGTARAVAAWGFAADGSAAPPPASPVDCSAAGACGPTLPVTLVPYGTTHLRMTQVPYTAPA
jgi:hypothetical protein